MVQCHGMGSETSDGREDETTRGGFRTRPWARRLAATVLVAGLGAVAWYVMGSTPVESQVEVQLTGGWPKVGYVDLVYFPDEGWDPQRKVRAFPSPGAFTVTDAPTLVAGPYRLEITVEHAGGVKRFTRDVKLERSATTTLDLRFGGD